MTLIFSYKSIYKSYGGNPVFENFSINIKAKEKLGLIGNNGSGKSTLLRILSGKDSPEKGEKLLKNLTRLVYLPQEDELDNEKTIGQIIFDALQKNNINDQEAYKIFRQVMGTGNFTNENLKCSELSGGWKKRLAIARALAVKPDILLLDEPTNHLDINGIIWLENILKNANFAFVLVSHDRCFLENTCEKIMEIGRYYPKGYFSVQGSYTKFEQKKTQFIEAQIKQESILSNKMRKETKWLRQGPKARSTKARFRLEQADKMRMELERVKSRNRLINTPEINFNSSYRKTKKLLTCINIGKSRNNKKLFENINLELLPGTRLGLMGENGSGKTSFMKILEGSLNPDTGEIKRADKLKIAVFDQTKSKLDPDITLKQALSPEGDCIIHKGQSIHVVSWARKFLFTADQLSLPLKRLSGGERTKVLIANLMTQPADILLLDEPTNDLDIPSIEVLEQSLIDFPGAIVLVSHDRFLIGNVTNSILYLDGKGSAEIFADYSQCLNNKKQSTTKKREKKQASTFKRKSPKNGKKPSIARLSYKDKYELEHMEEKILSAEEKAEKLIEKTKDDAVISNPEELSRIYTLLHKTQEEIDRLYARWKELEDLQSQIQ